MIDNFQEKFEVRDLREKGRFMIDDKFLDGYAKFLGVYSVGVYCSLCRHVNKWQKTWPSINLMGKELNIGRNKVIESIKYLEFWKIIKKQRLGMKCNNRYLLLKKTTWKTIKIESLKEFSEVCNVNFKGLHDKLLEFTTSTSIERKHIIKETQKKGVYFSKKKKPYYRGEEMRKKDGKWWVIPKEGGPWCEFADKESTIDWD